MKLFAKKQNYPEFPKEDHVPVLRCSICNGERVLCAKNISTGKLYEIMLVRSDDELAEYCKANAIDPESIEKVY